MFPQNRKKLLLIRKFPQDKKKLKQIKKILFKVLPTIKSVAKGNIKQKKNRIIKKFSSHKTHEIEKEFDCVS